MNTLAYLVPGRFRAEAGRRFVTPPRPKHPAPALPAGFEQTRFRGPTGRLNAYVGGRGPSVIVQHGWASRALDMAGVGKALLAPGMRVVMLDAPAHGESEGSEATMLDFAAGLEAAAKHLGPFDAIVAHSMGVPSAVLAMAEGSLDTTALVGIAGPDRLETYVRGYARQLGLAGRAVDLLLDAVRSRMGQPLERFDVSLDAPRMHAAAFFIHGTDDGAVPAESSRRIASSWPGAEVEIVEGLGHRRVLEDPSVLSKIASFLTQTLVGEDGAAAAP